LNNVFQNFYATFANRFVRYQQICLYKTYHFVWYYSDFF